MRSIIEALAGISGGAWLPFLTGVSLKSALVLLLALALTAGLRGRSASFRHHVWTLAFAAVLALPALAGLLPDWRVPVPVSSGLVQLVRGVEPVGVALPPPERGAISEAARTATSAPGREGADPAVPARVAGAPEPAGISVGRFAVFVWLIGALLLLGRLSIGVFSAWWVSRTATPLNDPAWRAMVRPLAGQLGLPGEIRVLRSGQVGTPMAWGLLRPSLLLPSDADDWSEDRRRAVLLHELAHLKRRDCLVQVVAQATRALHWFNPLAWVGIRRLQAERERACDDLVLVSGTRSADYARLLLDVARSRAADRRLGWAAVSMARPSQLEGRLLAILDPYRDRSGLGRVGSGIGLLSAAVLLLPLAAFSAAPMESASSTESPPHETADPAGLAGATGGIGSTGEIEGPLADRALSLMRDARREVEYDSRSHVDRRAVATSADTIQRRVLEAMVKALGDGDAAVREQAARTLGMWETPAAVDPLAVSVQEDSEAAVREQAAWALGMIEDASAVPALTAAVRDAEAGVREQAAWALGMIESPDGVPALVAALEGSDVGVREKAAWALGMIEDPGAVGSLSHALGDGSPDVREQAAWALGMIEDPGAVDGLVEALRTDSSPGVREQAAWALGMIEDGSAAEALIDALEDEDENVQKQAMQALARVLDDI